MPGRQAVGGRVQVSGRCLCHCDSKGPKGHAPRRLLTAHRIERLMVRWPSSVGRVPVMRVFVATSDVDRARSPGFVHNAEPAPDTAGQLRTRRDPPGPKFGIVVAASLGHAGAVSREAAQPDTSSANPIPAQILAVLYRPQGAHARRVSPCFPITFTRARRVQYRASR